MARRVFFSFHYKPDVWRTSQVRKIGALEGNAAVTDNEWETVTRGGDAAIEKWIDGQLHGRTCAIVLIGSHTAGRKWIHYEIRRAWDNKKGVVGIYIHKLKDRDGKQSFPKGNNPFDSFTVNGTPLSSIVKTYDSTSSDSQLVYKYISDHIANWVEEAISIRNNQ